MSFVITLTQESQCLQFEKCTLKGSISLKLLILNKYNTLHIFGLLYIFYLFKGKVYLKV